MTAELTYTITAQICTVESLISEIRRELLPTKQRVFPQTVTGIQLRLTSMTCDQLIKGHSAEEFRDSLQEMGMYVAEIDMKAFPQADFNKVADVLARLLPYGKKGQIRVSGDFSAEQQSSWKEELLQLGRDHERQIQLLVSDPSGQAVASR
ncbi:hypothetical protein [Pontibacter sp. G13]|uniref:hypothetical protein n=1 Tax=Pontibacter sp. G13 TaxID=3074898 RepID=UPI002889AA09|nr:hypothetical protein [Pontibacter sp. G13]WNJ17488.1 hypothetical protein RJD25_21785 [Pontibacter sp. G13]